MTKLSELIASREARERSSREVLYWFHRGMGEVDNSGIRSSDEIVELAEADSARSQEEKLSEIDSFVAAINSLEPRELD